MRSVLSQSNPTPKQNIEGPVYVVFPLLSLGIVVGHPGVEKAPVQSRYMEEPAFRASQGLHDQRIGAILNTSQVFLKKNIKDWLKPSIFCAETGAAITKLCCMCVCV